jgi:broad specificity phosphatase PhoE
MVAVERPPPEAFAAAMRSVERTFLFGVPEATEVWLVRHADCYEGITDREDPPLSPAGLDQARRLGARLHRAGYDAVYSSPLRRATQTAEAITGDYEVDGRLIEAEVELEDGRVAVTERPEHVLGRMRDAVDEAVRRHPGRRVVMVGHGLAILSYICDVLRLEFGSLRLMPYYTSVNVVRVLGEHRMAGSLADIAHLEAS